MLLRHGVSFFGMMPVWGGFTLKPTKPIEGSSKTPTKLLVDS